MAVVKHYSIKNSPLALLKYITGETKAQKAEIVRGINCSVDPKSAYLEMSLCYETFAGEKFHRTEKPEGKAFNVQTRAIRIALRYRLLQCRKVLVNISSEFQSV